MYQIEKVRFGQFVAQLRKEQGLSLFAPVWYLAKKYE